MEIMLVKRNIESCLLKALPLSIAAFELGCAIVNFEICQELMRMAAGCIHSMVDRPRNLAVAS
jgi:hypothetical protein